MDDPERKNYIRNQQTICAENQLAFVDSLVPVYKPLFRAVSCQQNKVIAAIAKVYGNPLVIGRIAQRTRIPYNTACRILY